MSKIVRIKKKERKYNDYKNKEKIPIRAYALIGAIVNIVIYR